MDKASLRQCQDIIGYTFRDVDLLVLALTHSSVASLRKDSNERLEFLGDAVLGLVVCQDLYLCDESLMEGEMTKIKSTVVSRQTCAEIADRIGISQALNLGKGMIRSQGIPQSVSAAVFESIIGAVYLDGGLDAARQFILTHVRPYVLEALADEHKNNYKSVLQQYSQRRWGATPEYLLLDEQGPDHSKCFEVAVSIGGKLFPSAWGKNKKEAEQEAARQSLYRLGILQEQQAGADVEPPAPEAP